MSFFYCQSYQAFTLALALNLEKNLTIISSNANILNACKKFDIKYIIHQEYKLQEFFITPRKVLYERRRIIELIKNDRFIYTHTQYALFCFILLGGLANRNEIVFYDIEYRYEDVKWKNLNIRFLYYKFIILFLKIFYNTSISIRENNNSIVLSLKDRFIEKYCITVKKDEKIEELILKLFTSHDYPLPKIKGILFIDQGYLKPTFDLLQVNDVLSLISKYKTWVKLHPIHGEKYEKYNFNYIDESIPIELYFKQCHGIVIASYSTALLFHKYFKNIVFIAIPFLVKDNLYREKIKNDKKIIPDGIHIANNINELRKIIEDHKYMLL